jgi:hypothetical protein
MNNPSNILPIFLYVIVNMKPVDMIMFRGCLFTGLPLKTGTWNAGTPVGHRNAGTECYKILTQDCMLKFIVKLQTVIFAENVYHSFVTICILYHSHAIE